MSLAFLDSHGIMSPRVFQENKLLEVVSVSFAQWQRAQIVVGLSPGSTRAWLILNLPVL